VLAIGNSVGDLVADTAVARAGYPGMGVASCFGSPLLNDVLGLSVALIVSLCISLLLVGQLFLLPVELQSTPPHLYRSGQQLLIFFSSLSVSPNQIRLQPYYTHLKPGPQCIYTFIY